MTATFKTSLTCTYVTNGDYCTDGDIAQIVVGNTLTAQACHDQCQTAMVAKGMARGCWVLAINGYCYCRSGTFATGDTSPGGSCQ